MKLPFELGTVRAQGHGTVFATFSPGPFVAGKAYELRVEGTYTENGRQYPFAFEQPLRIPAAAPGSTKASAAAVAKNQVKGAPYPARKPNHPEEVNKPSKWTVPIGTFRAPGPRSKGTTHPQKLKKDAPAKDAAGVTIFTNAGLGLSGNTINEPSGAVGGGVVFMTVNSFAAYSTNNGGSFTKLDPTTIFPNTLGGFCCDQVVEYSASIDRFIWVMQYGQGYRVAAASPDTVRNSSGTAWTYWDISAAQLGFTGGLDFPCIAVGNQVVYLNFDAQGGRVVLRIALKEIQAGGTINFLYTDPKDSPMAFFGHLSQNPQDEVFWAGHNSNSSMRVFSWAESSGTYFWRDVAIGSWPNDNSKMVSTTPDGQDWLSMLRSDNDNFIQGSTRVLSADRKTNQVWFAWTAPSGTNFPQPHVQIVVLDRANNFSLVSQFQIWNANFAFAYPMLAVNDKNEVGLSLGYGGGGNYENHAVGFWGDFIVYPTTSSNVGTTRYGDYVTIRQDLSQPSRFHAFGFGLIKDDKGTRTDTRYIAFGRP
jgi:hypothetical protein